MSFFRSIFFFLILVGTSCLTNGCTVTYNVPIESVDFPKINKIDMAVELYLSEELCNSKWEKKKFGDHYILPIGSSLCINSEAVAKALFSKVQTVRNKKIGSSIDADAVLIPNLSVIERDRPSTIFSDQTTTILFTWALNDTKGDPIWLTTIRGEGKGPMGHPLSKDAGREQIEMVLNDVFQQSFDEMSASHLIREFATEQLKSR